MALNPNEISPGEIHDLAERFETLPLTDVLRWAWERFGERAAIGTSFQGAGLVMIDHAVRAGIPLPVFTLDTQLLFAETYDLKRRLEERFGIQIEPLLPDQTPEQQAGEFGPELWKTKPRRLQSDTSLSITSGFAAIRACQVKGFAREYLLQSAYRDLGRSQ